MSESSIDYKREFEENQKELHDIRELLMNAVGKELDEYGKFLFFSSNKAMVKHLIDKAKG